MGLDAVVYRNKKHLQLGLDERASQLIPETGEVYFENDEISRKHREQVKAAEFRLGNIMVIAELRDELVRLVGPNNTLFGKILYSGSHSGDFIALRELPPISHEIALVRGTGRQSEEMNFFLN